jgi:AraC-like DNA-binding protein
LRPVHLLLFALLALLGESVLSAQPTITEYALTGAVSGAQAMTKGPDRNLWILLTGRIAKVTAEGGFCDQAHLVHEFRAFSGLPPESYLTAQRPFPNHVRTD